MVRHVYLVMNTGASPRAPGFTGGLPSASGGHHAVSSNYPPSLDLIGMGLKFFEPQLPNFALLASQCSRQP